MTCPKCHKDTWVTASAMFKSESVEVEYDDDGSISNVWVDLRDFTWEDFEEFTCDSCGFTSRLEHDEDDGHKIRLVEVKKR